MIYCAVVYCVVVYSVLCTVYCVVVYCAYRSESLTVEVSEVLSGEVFVPPALIPSDFDGIPSPAYPTAATSTRGEEQPTNEWLRRSSGFFCVLQFQQTAEIQPDFVHYVVAGCMC